MSPQATAIIVFIDDDGDEFPIMQFAGESLELVEAAAQALVGKDWNPTGELSLTRYRVESAERSQS